MKIDEITLLTKKQVNGLEIFRKYSGMTAITDFAIILGGNVENTWHNERIQLDERCCYYWTKSSNSEGYPQIVDTEGDVYSESVYKYENGIRPILPISSIDRFKNKVRNEFRVLEAEYGEYPQWAVKEKLSNLLEESFKANVLNKTGKVYTTDSRDVKDEKTNFKAQQHVEYEYEGKKYVRVKANLLNSPTNISNGVSIKTGDIVWVEV